MRKRSIVSAVGTLLGLLGAVDAMAFEKRAYEVVERQDAIEIRDYAPAVVAEISLEGDFEEVGGPAFRVLAAYISGENKKKQSLEPGGLNRKNQDSERIAMTAPVTQEATQKGYRVTFMMPSGRTLQDLPAPRDARVRLEKESAQRFAAIRYSGFWSQNRYQEELDTLLAWMDSRQLLAEGEPVWARYDPPFMPWFLRRNEILIPITP